MAKKQPPQHRPNNFAGRELTVEEAAKVLANGMLARWAWVVLAFFVGLTIFTAAFTLPAKAIAGTDTNFDFQISFAFNVGLAFTAASGIGTSASLWRSRRYYKRRCRQLEKDLAEAKGIELTVSPTKTSA